MHGSSRWTDAFEDANVFGDDPLEGFMGLEVYHGRYGWWKLVNRILGGVEQGK